MKTRDYRDYLQDILDAVNDIEDFIDDMTYEQFINDRKTLNAVVRSIEIIGEASKNIPQSIKEKYKALPWKQMAGMRDKLIHAYFGIDKETLWQAVTKRYSAAEKNNRKSLDDLEKDST